MEIIETNKVEDNSKLPWKLLLSADPSRKMIESYIYKSEIYTFSINEKVIGEYVLTKIDDQSVELKNIAVDMEFQGKGIGKQLVLDALKKAKRSGYKTVEIGTGNSSFSQLALYQKCGFRIIGVDKDFFTKNYTEKIIENNIECKDMIRLGMNLN